MKLDRSKLCTFQTPWGRYSFLRMLFVLNSAPENFYEIISKTFERIKNVTSFHDDILVWGDTQDSVRNTSHLFLEQASKQGIKFNPTKCEFCSHGIEFLELYFLEVEFQCLLTGLGLF